MTAAMAVAVMAGDEEVALTVTVMVVMTVAVMVVKTMAAKMVEWKYGHRRE